MGGVKKKRMADISTVLITGKVVKDCVYREKNDNKFASFSIAVNRYKRDASNNWVQNTDFFDCVAYGYTAETIRNKCGRGADVTISGTLRVDKWEKDAQKYSKVVIVAETVHINKSVKQDTSPASSPDVSKSNTPTPENTPAENLDFDEDIPF